MIALTAQLECAPTMTKWAMGQLRQPTCDEPFPNNRTRPGRAPLRGRWYALWNNWSRFGPTPQLRLPVASSNGN
ncbi:hypothetical protein M514_03332 [Trichuris suis]|uniref:Uncharacterized protein n=1 Tax=Trichuris suis TaxID=68888 RepID=A0A085NL84_9BILA|nr:hypothetical protein M513_03332 [Trichuris suis]KFD70230.1 hypothetical protein M514_03332 [Trichuris suis]